MDPIDLVVGRKRWRIAWESSPGHWVVQLWLHGQRTKTRPQPFWHTVAGAITLPLLPMAIKEAGFRAVYPEAVEPLCKAIQERMDAP